MRLVEQLFRFFDFGEILPRIEIDEDWREHLGYPRSAICAVKTRKSKCAAQLESLRPLASGDFQGSVEGIFGSWKRSAGHDATKAHPGHDAVRHRANAGRIVRSRRSILSGFPARSRLALPLHSPRQPASPKMVHKGSSHFREAMSSLGAFPRVRPFDRRHATLPGRSGRCRRPHTTASYARGRGEARIVSVCCNMGCPRIVRRKRPCERAHWLERARAFLPGHSPLRRRAGALDQSSRAAKAPEQETS